MKSKRTNVQEAPEYEQEALEYEEEASEHEQEVSEHEQANESPEEESAEALTIESHPSVPSYPFQIDGPNDLKEFLSEIWNNKKGVKKVRQQRASNKLSERNDSTKGVLNACSDIMRDIKDATGTSTEMTDVKSAQVRDAVAILASELDKFDLANKREIKNFLFQDVYAYIFPGLLRALCKIVDFYAQSFCGDDGSIPTAQLEEIAFFMAAIINLNERAKSTREPELIRDIDVNGQPFDRVVMFHHPRTNPRRHSLEMTQELVGVDWTDLECLTLMEALAKYTAIEFSKPRHMVYRKIIKSHCRPGGALRRFNVLEIVQKSQYLKRMLGDREWTERIPTF
ncbi:Guanine nucleotide-binding protein [Lasiodiplodia theobromae]|uniref:Guanine nucleotide-binding protein n=1 Tax=Lasiodiplodia theobromae TaxID=45133 RepID=UPI0015C2C480|nr:Guanine nucleotide-binding protein [Lasiodiplodia theobromae]KAF4543212.1 Guanine nucleotide-binding protein [Lasiodiplodia theobromae]